jgi:2'-5' RNA ligase
VGVSLWLVPPAPVRARLAATVKALAARFGTPRFTPHVTLLPGIRAGDQEVRARLRELRRGIPALVIRLEDVLVSDAYFRRLFVRAECTAALRQAHARAAAAFGREPDPDFLPHLSLLYGRVPASSLREWQDRLEHEVRVVFEAEGPRAWRTEGPVTEWRPLRTGADRPAPPGGHGPRGPGSAGSR